MVAHKVGDELEFLGFVSIALLGGLHIKQKGSCWVESSVLQDVSVGDGSVTIVGAVVPGVPAFGEWFAVVPLEPSFGFFAVKINNTGVEAFLLSGTEVSQVELFAIDDVIIAHRGLLRFDRLILGLWGISFGKVINHLFGNFFGRITDLVSRSFLNGLTINVVGNRDHKDFTVWRIQFLDSGIVEVFGVRDDCCVERNTFVFFLSLFNFQLDDFIDCGKGIHDFDRLIFLVDRSDNFGNLLDRDHHAYSRVNDGLKDVIRDVLRNISAKLSFEDSIDLGLVDERLTDIREVLEEVLGDIDLVLLLVIGVWLEPLPRGIAGVALGIAVGAVVAALSGIGLGKCLVVPGDVDGLADGSQASDGELSSHGCLQELVFLFYAILFLGFIKVRVAEKTGIIYHNLAQININPQ